MFFYIGFLSTNTKISTNTIFRHRRIPSDLHGTTIPENNYEYLSLGSLWIRRDQHKYGEGEIRLGVKKEKMGMDGNDVPKWDYKSHITSHITKNLENSSFLENSRRFSTLSKIELLSVFFYLFRHPFLDITF